MPSSEQVQDLIDRAKAWTGETPLDADTFSLMRQMWTMLGEIARDGLVAPDADEIKRQTLNQILNALEEYRNSRKSVDALRISTDMLRVARGVAAQFLRSDEEHLELDPKPWKQDGAHSHWVRGAIWQPGLAYIQDRKKYPAEVAHAGELCVFCEKPIVQANIRQSKFGWRHLDGMRDFRPGMGGHDARPFSENEERYDEPKKAPKLSKLVKQAASEQMGGYPDESLLRLYRVLKDEGL